MTNKYKNVTIDGVEVEYHYYENEQVEVTNIEMSNACAKHLAEAIQAGHEEGEFKDFIFIAHDERADLFGYWKVKK